MSISDFRTRNRQAARPAQGSDGRRRVAV